MSFRDNSDNIHDRIVPGTTRLIGLGRGSFGELWGTNHQLKSLQPLGCFENRVGNFGGDSHGAVATDAADCLLSLPQLRGEEQVQIKQIDCGVFHVIMLDFDGKCWGLGDNDEGQLGMGKNQMTIAPTLISGGDLRDEFIERVGAGGWFSAFLNCKGHLFTCGDIHRQFQQYVQQKHLTRWVLRRATTLPGNALPSVHHGDDDDDDNRLHFDKLACGDRFLLVQDKWTKQVYGLGTSEGKALSTLQAENGTLSKVYYIDSGTGEKRPLNFSCQKLDAGERLSAVLDDRGALFIAGDKGDDEPTFSMVHELFDRDIQLVDVCCSWSHFIALDRKGVAHLGSISSKSGLTFGQLNFFGPVLQIGAGDTQLYARTNQHIFRVPEQDMSGLGDETLQLGEALPFGDGFDPSDRDYVKLTGSLSTTVIHQAQLRASNYRLSQCLQRLSLKRQMCDVIVTFTTLK